MEIRGAFHYDPKHDYAAEEVITIGSMSKVCNYCRAKKWDNEPPGVCCSNGKVQLATFQEPPQPLKNLLTGSTSDSKHFLQHIQKYNSAFQMTSFGAKFVTQGGFMPTFKVQGQVYHRIGSLLPEENENWQFLQIYFMGIKKTKLSFDATITFDYVYTIPAPSQVLIVIICGKILCDHCQS